MNKSQANAVMAAGGRVRRANWNHWLFIFSGQQGVQMRGLTSTYEYHPSANDESANDWEVFLGEWN